MSDLKVYFTESEDYLRRWFKEQFEGETSSVVKNYIRNLYDGDDVVPGGAVVDELLRARMKLELAFSDVMEVGGERAWLIEMQSAQLDGADIVARRIMAVKERYPELSRHLSKEFGAMFPLLAGCSGRVRR